MSIDRNRFDLQEIEESRLHESAKSFIENVRAIGFALQPAKTFDHITGPQSIETIRARVDTLGVSEPVIQEHGLGENQILVQLPGVDDPTRVKDIIQSTAMLEIKQGFGHVHFTEIHAGKYVNPLRPGGIAPYVDSTSPTVVALFAGGALWILVVPVASAAGAQNREPQCGW